MATGKQTPLRHPSQLSRFGIATARFLSVRATNRCVTRKSEISGKHPFQNPRLIKIPKVRDTAAAYRPRIKHKSPPHRRRKRVKTKIPRLRGFRNIFRRRVLVLPLCSLEVAVSASKVINS